MITSLKTTKKKISAKKKTAFYILKWKTYGIHQKQLMVLLARMYVTGNLILFMLKYLLITAVSTYNANQSKICHKIFKKFLKILKKKSLKIFLDFSSVKTYSNKEEFLKYFNKFVVKYETLL